MEEEHAELHPHIDALKAAADAAAHDRPQALEVNIGEAREFLSGHLIPHVVAEERQPGRCSKGRGPQRMWKGRSSGATDDGSYKPNATAKSLRTIHRGAFIR